MISLRGFIWVIYAGFVIGILITYYNKAHLGSLVKRVFSSGADSPDTSKTLTEMGIRSSALVKNSLKEGRSLRKYIRIANPDEALTRIPAKKRGRLISFLFPEKEHSKCDFDRAKLFISKDDSYTADSKYVQKNISNPLFLIVWIGLLTALAFALTIFIPDLLQLSDNFLSNFLG